MPQTIVAFGELLWDLLPSGPVLGGAPGNFAYRINSLGARGVLVSRVGRDALGQKALDALALLGMETAFIQRDDQKPTGTVEVSLDAQGTPDFYIVPGVAYDGIECTQPLLGLARGADCLCFGTLVQRSERSRAALRAMLQAASDVTRLLDINLRKNCYTRETIAESLQQADILKLNEPEAEFLARMFGLPHTPLDRFAEEALRRWELSHCVITLGERGAFAASASGQSAYSPGFGVRVVDTCGSGDAFAAGFLKRLLEGAPLPECLEFGNSIGAIVSTQRGATEPVSQANLLAFQDSRPERIWEPALRT
jgi:fructokinase